MSLEKKLERMYQKGLQEGEELGYIKGSDDAHKGWIQALREVPGIGPKRFKAIMKARSTIAEATLRQKNTDKKVR
ncbi:hypothetical protein [Ammoniphilus resinae]|uniref:Uncharacterized protein n=1 Tax=Ammoniphilus resinae TaxID=861532 RepID=A0ABS4GP80_9BACL|nr:hypothetical protein [Ammoniphilus resinae]MBP1931867.1 hypothetical protein [Ammoniphilus resinae]